MIKSCQYTKFRAGIAMGRPARSTRAKRKPKPKAEPSEPAKLDKPNGKRYNLSKR